MDKICIACKKSKNVSEFPPNKSTKDGLNRKCRLCFNEYMKQWYAKNKEAHVVRTTKVKKETREKVLSFLWDYFITHPCVHCGETDPIVLEFDHIDKDQKEFGIHFLVKNGNSLDKIKKEISKCRVLCCNCHRRRTAKQLGWWRNSR